MSDNGVAALAVFLIFGAPIGAFIVNRILAHRERIEMIRRGMMPPPQAYRNAKDWRNAGSPGMGMPGTSVPPPGAAWQPSPVYQDAPDRSLRKGIMLALIGLAILIGLSFIGSDTSGPMNSLEIHPGPWLLGGLIPMFVGIAQIIVALLSGARLGPIGQPPPDANYYRGQPQPPPDVHVYGAQPRSNGDYEELRRPTPPPERR